MQFEFSSRERVLRPLNKRRWTWQSIILTAAFSLAMCLMGLMYSADVGSLAEPVLPDSSSVLQPISQIGGCVEVRGEWIEVGREDGTEDCTCRNDTWYGYSISGLIT